MEQERCIHTESMYNMLIVNKMNTINSNNKKLGQERCFHTEGDTVKIVNKLMAQE